MNNEIKIGSKFIGTSHPSYIIAELSGNHGGSLEKAKTLIRAAAAAGADAIKLQVYRPDTITLNVDSGDFAIAKENAWAAYKNLYELYEYAHTPWDWLPDLFTLAAELDIELFGSVFDHTSVDELEQYPVNAYKIASPEIVDLALLEKVALTGKPVILSTGLANIEDVSLAVSCLKSHGCNDIVLLKCTTAYPTPVSEVNLRTIQNLTETFDCHAGLSDHTVGIGVSVAAAVLGARAIEKHIKLDDGLETVDSFFSLSIPEFANMITEIRRAEQAIGTVQYGLTASSSENKNGRRSLYVSAPIKQGEKFTRANVKSVRPGFGLAPKYLSEVLTKTAIKDLSTGDRLSWDVMS